jgi:GH15 family glucan-1,4-alpha-glucosidase
MRDGRQEGEKQVPACTASYPPIDSYAFLADGQSAALIYQQRAGALTLDHWSLLRSLVEFTVRHWREPDHGIWEVRSERRQFTHSKVMAWAA